VHDRFIRSPQDIFEQFHERLRYLQHEEFWVVFLNSKNKVIGEERISVGSLNLAVVHPREVFKSAIRRSANAIIAVHNHPSGSTDSSYEDRQLTSRLQESGNVMGIELLDHVIIADSSYHSFKEHGEM